MSGCTYMQGRLKVLTQNRTMLEKFITSSCKGSQDLLLPSPSWLAGWKCCIPIYSSIFLPNGGSCEGQGAGASSVVVHSNPQNSKGTVLGGMNKYIKIRIVDRYFELHPCWHVQQQRLFFFLNKSFQDKII